MLKKFVTVVLVATMSTAVAWAAPPSPHPALDQDAKTVLANASKAMGAENLKTIQYSGTGTEFAFGQAFNPSSPGRDLPISPTREPSITKCPHGALIASSPMYRRIAMAADCLPVPRRPWSIGANTPWANQVDLWMTPSVFCGKPRTTMYRHIEIHGREEIHRRDVHRAQQGEI